MRKVEVLDALYDAKRPLGYVTPFWVFFALHTTHGSSHPHPEEGGTVYHVPTAEEERDAMAWLEEHRPGELARVPMDVR